MRWRNRTSSAFEETTVFEVSVMIDGASGIDCVTSFDEEARLSDYNKKDEKRKG